MRSRLFIALLLILSFQVRAADAKPSTRIKVVIVGSVHGHVGGFLKSALEGPVGAYLMT